MLALKHKTYNLELNMNLKEKYKKEVVPQMMEKMGYKNIMAVPRLEKAVCNVGFGRQVVGKTSDEQKKVHEAIINDLSIITGQKPVLTRAKKAIAAFKTRKGMPVGACCTLRGQKMYDFLERVIGLALPRSRDFQGIEVKSVDQNGNLTFAIKEQIAFPEISPEKTKMLFSFEITVATNAKKKEEGLALLRLLGFPIRT